METQTVNIILSSIVVMLVVAVLFVRENASALELLSNWAASRAWGLKCAKVEMERRHKEFQSAS